MNCEPRLVERGGATWIQTTDYIWYNLSTASTIFAVENNMTRQAQVNIVYGPSHQMKFTDDTKEYQLIQGFMDGTTPLDS
jgi:hypothetical protein